MLTLEWVCSKDTSLTDQKQPTSSTDEITKKFVDKRFAKASGLCLCRWWK